MAYFSPGLNVMSLYMSTFRVRFEIKGLELVMFLE